MNKICTFVGHGDIYGYHKAHYNNKEGELKEIYQKAIIDLIENYDITEFYSSGLGNFDSMGATIVYKLQKEEKYSHIKSVRVLNCVPPILTDEEKEVNELHKANVNYHQTVLAENAELITPKARIPNANKYMVKSADIILAGIKRTAVSGAYNTYKLAKKQNKHIINLFDLDN